MTDHEWLTERAAILQFDAGLSRQEADRQAAAMLQTLQTARGTAGTAPESGSPAKRGSDEQTALW